MSSLVELLYRLRPGELDEPMQWLVPTFTEDSFSDTQVQVGAPTLGRAVPIDEALVLQTFVVAATPGAGQNVTGMFLDIVNETLLTQFVIAQDRIAGAANVSKTLQAVGVGLIIPAASIIRARCTFNAGAAANNVILELGGLRIPLGNINRR